MIPWLNEHKFQIHLAAFALMIVTSIGLYFVSDSGSSGLTWGLLTVFALVNGLVIFLK